MYPGGEVADAEARAAGGHDLHEVAKLQRAAGDAQFLQDLDVEHGMLRMIPLLTVSSASSWTTVNQL